MLNIKEFLVSNNKKPEHIVFKDEGINYHFFFLNIYLVRLLDLELARNVPFNYEGKKYQIEWSCKDVIQASLIKVTVKKQTPKKVVIKPEPKVETKPEPKPEPVIVKKPIIVDSKIVKKLNKQNGKCYGCFNLIQAEHARLLAKHKLILCLSCYARLIGDDIYRLVSGNLQAGNVNLKNCKQERKLGNLKEKFYGSIS